MAFFTYHQNNSGGVFDYDEVAGIAPYVIVEADSAREADFLAEGIGLYFDGEGDCPCCGDRWYPADTSWGEKGTDQPEIYGELATTYGEDFYFRPTNKHSGFIHYKNADITPFGGVA
jgi:hypothetical protein